MATVRALLPYLWPEHDTGAKVRVVLAMGLLLAAKVATVYVPVIYGRIVDALAPRDNTAALVIPVALVIAYGLLRMGSAVFGELRDALFAKVQQRAVRTAARRTFEHLHALSLRFHLDRQTGALARAIDRGSAGIQSVLRLAVFNVVPTVIELLLVTAIIWHLFDWRFAAITFAAVVSYAGFTMSFATWRSRIRRTMNDTDNDASTKALDSLLNYETVKYFGNEPHEVARYDGALARYERAAVRVQVSLNVLNIGQAFIIAAGLTLIMLMATREVHGGTMTVGQFVLVNTYLMQLYQPLGLPRHGVHDDQAGTGRHGADVPPARGRSRDRRSSECDGAGRAPVRRAGGRAAVRGRAFRLPTGSHDPQGGRFHRARRTGKLAIVGPTGAGKSTISRLLFRFYDVTDGRIRIDGQDIRDVTQESLRAAIGVVPQDTVLFNDTIRYNIAYGRVGATQDEIEHAASLAQVHEFIASLPEGYDTRVGERGLKLSGGEKQRVAIARTILKDPRILILDEATSALDTGTEQDIQAALRAVSRHRTTLVIAHRLSTVVDADEIIVLQDGRVAERGRHAALLARDGLYARMWALQAEQETEPEIAD